MTSCQHLWSHAAKEVINTVILAYFNCQEMLWCSITEMKIFFNFFLSNPQGNNWEDKRKTLYSGNFLRDVDPQQSGGCQTLFSCLSVNSAVKN